LSPGATTTASTGPHSTSPFSFNSPVFVSMSNHAAASLAGAVPNSGGSTSHTDAATVAQLQVAAKQALTDGRNGNKNNAEFLRKNYEINQLVDRLQSGQQVDPSDIDKALEPVHTW
jgi:hypothetical protein